MKKVMTKIKPPKRYDFVMDSRDDCDPYPTPVPEKDGEWVRAEDYDALLKAKGAVGYVDQSRISELEAIIRELEGEKAVWRQWQNRALAAENKFQSLAIDLSHVVRRYQDQQ